MNNKLCIGITQGDTNGVGCEVIIKALADNRILDMFTPVVYSSSRIMGYYRKLVPTVEKFDFHTILSAKDLNPKMINVVQCVPDQLLIEPGLATSDGARAALIALQTAVKDLKEGKIQALVTGPFNKHTVNEKGFAFPGHTEYLTNAFLGSNSLMLLCSDSIKIGVVTGHIPLADVANTLTIEGIVSKLRVFSKTLYEDFSIERPKIAVLGLNPHAGENGMLGKQEETIISPAIEQAAKEGILAFGPFPSDSFFANSQFAKFNGILAMYHDQGLIPFKTLAFDQGVNFTAGLSIIRTSPDHGTAYDIVGKNMASPSSMLAAIYTALDIYAHRAENKRLQLGKMKPYKVDGEQEG